MRLGEGFQAVPVVAPNADNRCRGIGDGQFVHREIGAREESPHGRSHQEGRKDTVAHECDAETFHPQNIAFLVLELIGHGLEYEGHKEQDPNPVGSAETGAVKQRERGEESTAKGDQRGESEFPLAPGGIQDHAFAGFIQRTVPQMQVGSLDKHQEHQQSCQKGHKAPPVLL